jgi:hypothetical protein
MDLTELQNIENLEETPNAINSSSLSEIVQSTISRDLSSEGIKSEIIEHRDASSESAKVLVPQMASDRNALERGENDWRRLTNIKLMDVFWISYFWNKPPEQGGNWLRKFIENYCNYSYSIKGENKKLMVAMQQAIMGTKKEEKEDKRSWTQRNITQRGIDPTKKQYYDIN